MAAVSSEAKARAKETTKAWWREHKNYLNDYNKKKRATPEGWVKQAIRTIRGRAKRKGMEFNIDRTDLKLPQICPVLGIPILLGVGGSGMKAPNSPSVDRFDNTKGYIKGNVRVISNRANILKRDATLEEMRAIVRYMEIEEWN